MIYEYLLCCSATDEKDQWSVFSFVLRYDSLIKTMRDILEVQPIAQKAAEDYFGIKFKSFFILMFNKLEVEEEGDRNTEKNSAE